MKQKRSKVTFKFFKEDPVILYFLIFEEIQNVAPMFALSVHSLVDGKTLS